MSIRRFTVGQIADLLNNKNVLRCSPKSITYNHAFKINTVKRYDEEGVGARQIFEEAGFNLSVVGYDTPSECVGRWKRTCKQKGEAALTAEKRGKGIGVGKGRPRSKGITDAEKIKRLELTVLYLKAENDFLAKLRAGLVE